VWEDGEGSPAVDARAEALLDGACADGGIPNGEAVLPAGASMPKLGSFFSLGSSLPKLFKYVSRDWPKVSAPK
jgi:hypothetical protein